MVGSSAKGSLGRASPLSPEEDYELQTTSPANEPLLPRYDPKSPSLSPYQQVQYARRRNRACSTVLCLWATLMPLVLTSALLGCWFGRQTLDNVRGWQAWEQMPQDVKDWLDKVAPYQHIADHGSFPTE
jgi:hypothetical protein